MFLALVVTPELREFLARARCGAVRLIKVCILEGKWNDDGSGKIPMSKKSQILDLKT